MRNLWFIFILIIAFMACSDDKDVLAPVPNDVTLNELELGRLPMRFQTEALLRKRLTRIL